MDVRVGLGIKLFMKIKNNKGFSSSKYKFFFKFKKMYVYSIFSFIYDMLGIII